jgi:L-iditol 2-dehydrogenase
MQLVGGVEMSNIQFAAGMKAAAITGPKVAGTELVTRPEIADDFALIKIEVAPLCTEYKAFQAGRPMIAPGHEAAGEVVDIGRSGRVKRGDRVVVMPGISCGQCACCRGGEHIFCDHLRMGHGTIAQYTTQRDWLLLPIPDNMSYEHASMACCGLGPSFGAMERLQLDRYDTVLMTGMGPVGLGAVINARHRGARIIAVENHPYRAALAAELGADHVLDPSDPDILALVRDLTGGRGVDKAIEFSGALAAQRLCIDAARRRGALAFVAECQEDLKVKISPDLIRKGLTMLGSWHYSLKDAPKLMGVIEECTSSIDRFITHTYPLDRIQDAWTLQSTGACGKVLIRPHVH